MDTTATTPNLEARIAAERKRLFDEQALQVELEKQRLIPLEAGNDEVLDEIEQKIVKSIERAERVQERLGLLERRLAESKNQDETKRLDEVAATAERARQAGARILSTTYPKLAKQLAVALAELRHHQQTIVDANRELLAAKRETVELADKERFSIDGPQGLSIAVVPLHEYIVLPGENADTPNYWTPNDVRHEHSMLTIGALGMRNGNLLVK